MKGFDILKYYIRRGDVYWIDLGTPVGSEQGYERPCVVVQNNVGNYKSKTTIVVPTTTKSEEKHHVMHVYFCMNGVNNIALTEQIRVISEDRFMIDKYGRPKYICSLSKKTMNSIDKAIGMSIGIIPLPPKSMKKN